MGTNDTASDTDTSDTDTDDGRDWKADAEKWKRLARKHENQAKANLAELEKLKADGQSANSSDMEKLQATIAELKDDLAEERRKVMVAEVADDRGLTKAQAKRLQGKTREELEADADEIVETFGIKPAKDKTKDEGDKPKEEGDKPNDESGKPFDEGSNGDGAKPTASGKPKEKLRPGAAPEADPGKSGEQLADEVWKRTHGGI